MVSVLITGGGGFIGSYIVQKLVDNDITPIIYDFSSRTELIRHIIGKVTIVTGDIRDVKKIVNIIKQYKPQCIIHLSTSRVADLGKKDPMHAFKVDVEGLANVLEAARILGVNRVVFASSASVYDDLTGTLREDGPTNPMSVYAANKIQCEVLGAIYDKLYELTFVALRIFSAYGYGEKPWKKAWHGLEAVEAAVKGKPIRVPYGDTLWEYTFVKDIADAFVSACTAKDLKSKVFNIGSGARNSKRDIVDAVRKVIPEAVIEIGTGWDPAWPDRGVADISRARKELGFSPRGLEAGIKDLIERLRVEIDRSIE